VIAADLESCEATLRARGRPCRVLEITGSTNDEARAWASAGAESFSVVVADSQTRGRGRHGRSWSSPKSSTLAMSIVVRPKLAPANLPPLSIVVGLAVHEVLSRRLDRPVSIKWPNDVLVSGKKLAGILVEASLLGSSVDFVVVGIGINVARTEFPEELASRATSLELESARSLDRTALAVEIVDALEHELDAFVHDPNDLPARLAKVDALFGRPVHVENGASGIADGLAPDGRLRVRLADGSIALAAAGEVTVDAPGWVSLLPANEVAEGDHRFVEAEGIRLLVHRVEGAFFVTSSQCPHEEFTMDRCVLRGPIITCTEHGWRMDVRDGRVVEIGDADARLPVYAAEIRDGVVWAKLF